MSGAITGKPLEIEETPIPGFLRIDLTAHSDNHGWFKENWQREKMLALDLPDFRPVQDDVSFNDKVRVTRGIHAEPWDKSVSVATGRVFGARVDLQERPSFDAVYTTIIDSSAVVYVPRGVGNFYQALESDTAYTYLVNDHWSPDTTYTFLNLADGTAAVDWPIPLAEAILSDRDKAHPRMAQVTPSPALTSTGKRVLVTGANGQLGHELIRQLSKTGYQTTGVDLPEIDISDVRATDAFDWSHFDIVINAAVWTNVDGAESPGGRPTAQRADATGPANLAKAASTHDLTLMHISAKHVFDDLCSPHLGDEAPSPLGVYAQAKVEDGAAITAAPKRYLVRTSWAIGDGKNFPHQMLELTSQGIVPQVMSDQAGRLTFAGDLAAGILHPLETKAEYGTYNLSGEGPVVSWADIARRVYELASRDPDEVTPVSTEEYFSDREGIVLRPLASTLDLGEIKAAGFTPADSMKRPGSYVRPLLESKGD